jgi:hypothetical protein
MELEIDGAYYRDGSQRRSLQDYLGDETANYEIRANGSLNRKRPANPVLISEEVVY